MVETKIEENEAKKRKRKKKRKMLENGFNPAEYVDEDFIKTCTNLNLKSPL
jgi:hypothetical protein